VSPPPLYIILDSPFASKPLEPLLEIFSKAGVGWVQLREKKASSRAFFETAQSLVSLCRQYRLTSIINDRVDIALLTDADGVHVGQNDLPVEEARRLLGRNKVVGVSTHNLKQALEAQRSTADYVAIGPVYPTTSKQNPDPIVPREELRAIRSQVTKPLVAIGGITVENAAALYELGINSLAVIRDILLSDNLKSRIQQYLDLDPSR
jgi:thiamine-phosphate pyrophosphorylase